MAKNKTVNSNPDVVLIGAGIMSATLATMLKLLKPNLTIQVYERLGEIAAESSDAWNNAGTGHSAFCELNYTPQKPDGSVEINKAVKIAEMFEVSRQFWAYLVENNIVDKPEAFIRNVPHLSFVWGEENVAYLKKRYTALKSNALFKDMEYTEDHAVMKQWMPLVMENRKPDEKLAATKMEMGTDIDFGELARSLFRYLENQEGINLYMNREVRDLEKLEDGRWAIKVKNLETGSKKTVNAKFLFIGAGGGALPLLLKSGIPEGRGFGGFPVSGQWLKCVNPELIAKHEAKVYGKAAVGAPPMSVPHLDTRVIKGEKALLFGPYAGFSTKFLKHGSWMDLPRSIKFGNIRPMLAAGWDNMDLTKYLIEQVRQSPEDRLEALRDFIPDAKLGDWELEIAGQRVQVIKKDPEHGGVLEFGTEIVHDTDGTIAALLGASPGASTAVSIMIDLINKCFPERVSKKEAQESLRKLFPSYGKSLAKNPELCQQLRQWTAETLKLNVAEPVTA